MLKSIFKWDKSKNLEDQEKHGESLEIAQYAFLDENRVFAEDSDHSLD